MQTFADRSGAPLDQSGSGKQVAIWAIIVIVFSSQPSRLGTARVGSTWAPVSKSSRAK